MLKVEWEPTAHFLDDFIKGSDILTKVEGFGLVLNLYCEHWIQYKQFLYQRSTMRHFIM